MQRPQLNSTVALISLFLACPISGRTAALKVGVFDVDATPPVGSILAYDPVTNRWDLGLRARGVVLLGAESPVVLCSVDWLGIANGGHDAFREALAQAAGTDMSRVSVHTVHQHDAPDCDFSAEKILRDAGIEPLKFDGTFQRRVIGELAAAVKESVQRAQPVSHLGLGEGRVREVASNRRIPGPDGKVRAVRWTAMPNAELRAEPEGVVDPVVSLVSFWNGDRPVAVLSYYATHPQSYYRTGIANPDFPGVARFLRQLAVPGALHIHFNGAGGNIGAGKYNDGSPENRLRLAERLAEGMRQAWDSTRREVIDAESTRWTTELIGLIPAAELDKAQLEAQLAAREAAFIAKGGASRLAWLRRMQSGQKLQISCLTLGKARILHMPGELFVEYQLGAKSWRPDLFVAMAAYGDYSPWYIGTTAAYAEGGYETGPYASNVGPEAEPVLTGAIRKLLGVPENRIDGPRQP